MESNCRRQFPRASKKATFDAENIVGKRDTTAYQHFLLFPECFQT